MSRRRRVRKEHEALDQIMFTALSYRLLISNGLRRGGGGGGRGIPFSDGRIDLLPLVEDTVRIYLATVNRFLDDDFCPSFYCSEEGEVFFSIPEGFVYLVGDCPLSAVLSEKVGFFPT